VQIQEFLDLTRNCTKQMKEMLKKLGVIPVNWDCWIVNAINSELASTEDQESVGTSPTDEIKKVATPVINQVFSSSDQNKNQGCTDSTQKMAPESQNVPQDSDSDESVEPISQFAFPKILDPLIKQYRSTLFSGKRGKSKLYKHKFYVNPDYKSHRSKHYELAGKKKIFKQPIIEDWKSAYSSHSG